MDALVTLALLAVLLAAPCFVQLVLWIAYASLKTVVRWCRHGPAEVACSVAV